MKKRLLLLVLSTFFLTQLFSSEPALKKTQKFSFAFFTDIHLNKGDNNCFQGLQMAIESAKSNKSDFVLTGGDNVDIDVLGKDTETAHELYQRYSEVIVK